MRRFCKADNKKMTDIFGQTPTQLELFFILYGVTGAVPLIAALYLLLRRGNAIAPDITPPLRLRCWAASLLAVTSLSHVWWLLFLICSREIYSVGYVLVVVVDGVTLLTTIAGTLLSMLQDRRRPIWPALVAIIPFAAICGVFIVHPSDQFKQIAIAYIMLLYLIFTTYMVFAVRRYGQWLNENYADLENKKVWLSQVVALGCMLFFILYLLVANLVLIYFMHFVELVLCGLLLWRVETLPQLDSKDAPDSLTLNVSRESEETSRTPSDRATEEPASTLPSAGEAMDDGAVGAVVANIDLAQTEQLLAERCVATQLYLQHDLTLQQLAYTIGTNRFYLSQYFSRQGITYNIYINNLRINHFISRCQEATAAGQPVIAQHLARESGYRSYSTFSLAFKQRTGQSVTAWMHDTDTKMP